MNRAGSDPVRDGAELARQLRSGSRRALAKAITLVESTREDHARRAQELLAQVTPFTGTSVRVGLSGVPGVGKSTFIEGFGTMLAERGHRVAVLAVDPSSGRSGGSILGDKTRMPRLSVHPRAFVRPSPSGGTLGGVARRTRETMLLCEAAGYDVILVETVGVGQSETAVSGMTDTFVLLTLPNAGDDLQGIKRGIMELADLIVVNKADTDPAAANRAQQDLRGALRLLGLHGAAWQPRVLQASALGGQGLGEVWQAIRDHREALGARLQARRESQNAAWFDELLREAVWQAFTRKTAADRLRGLRERVAAGSLPPAAAVRELMGEG